MRPTRQIHLIIFLIPFFFHFSLLSHCMFGSNPLSPPDPYAFIHPSRLHPREVHRLGLLFLLEEIGDRVLGFQDRIRGEQPIKITYFSLLGPEFCFFLTVVDAHHTEPPHLEEHGGGHGDDEQHQLDIGAL